eukprot:scaffold6126_cov296-Prasinococcus_capsulatus_cf.AAC.2
MGASSGAPRGQTDGALGPRRRVHAIPTGREPLQTMPLDTVHPPKAWWRVRATCVASAPVALCSISSCGSKCPTAGICTCRVRVDRPFMRVSRAARAAPLARRCRARARAGAGEACSRPGTAARAPGSEAAAPKKADSAPMPGGACHWRHRGGAILPRTPSCQRHSSPPTCGLRGPGATPLTPRTRRMLPPPAARAPRRRRPATARDTQRPAAETRARGALCARA